MNASVRMLLCGGLLAAIGFAPALGQDSGEVRITSVPDGAEILLNGQSVGLAPIDLALPSGLGSATVGARAAGYSEGEILVPLAGAEPSYEIPLDRLKSTIPVTTEADLPMAADGEITLREALSYANGARRPSGADRALIEGWPGAGRPDDIVIRTKIRSETPVLTVDALLPPLDDAGDRLIGPELGATIAPVPGRQVPGAGLRLGPGTELADIALSGFEIGLEARGWGTVYARGATVTGARIGFHATDGAELLLSGAAADATTARAVATDTGVVDGLVEDLTHENLDAYTIRSGPPAQDRLVVVNGNLPVTGQFNLFVREDAPKPLREIEGLQAVTTSYDLYQIFGAGQQWQRWPWHVYDGLDGDYFQWAIRGNPTSENMHVLSQRPLRTSRFTLHHLQGDSTLHKYRFSLIDRNRAVLWSTEVSSDGTLDKIAVDPEIDFFGFRIDVLEVTGTGPGFSEIEAEVFDTVAYPALSHDSRRAVFPRPPEGKQGMVEIGNRLHIPEEKLFTPVFSLAVDQRGLALPSEDVEVVILPETATGADLAAAIEGQNWTQRVRVEVPGVLSIDPNSPILQKPYLHLTGGGTVRSTGGAALMAVEAHGLLISNLTLDGITLDLASTRRATLYDVDLTGNQGLVATWSDVSVIDSRISGEETAIQGTGSALTIIGSKIHASGTGVNTQVSSPLTMVGNEIDAGLAPLMIRSEGGYAHLAHLIANRATPVGENVPLRQSQNSQISLVALNDPPHLSMGVDNFSLRTRPTWAGGFVQDLRTGLGPSHVRVLNLGADPTLSCVLLPDQVEDAPALKSTELGSGATVVLHDTPLSLVCARGEAGASLRLPVEDTGEVGVPALAHISLTLPPAEADGLIAAVGFDARIEAIGDGQPLRALGSAVSDDALRSLIVALHKAGNYAVAFERAHARFAEDPRNPAFEALTLYAATEWAHALQERGRFEAGRELIEDLTQSDPQPAGLTEQLVSLMDAEARSRFDTGDWPASRELLREMAALQPENEGVAQNLRYSYSEESMVIFNDAGADGLLDWVTSVETDHPGEAHIAREFASIQINAALIDAIDAGEIDEGLRLASLDHSLAPSDTTQQNLEYAFQLIAMRDAANGDFEAVFDKAAALRERHGDGVDFLGTAAVALNNAAVEAYNAGRSADALQIASRLYTWGPTADRENLLRAAFQARIDDLLQAGDANGIVALLGDMNGQHGELGLAADVANAFGAAAQIALDAGDPDGAQANAELLYAIAPSQEAAGLLSYVLSIRAQDLAEAGSADSALEYLAAAAARYPELNELAQNAQAIGSNAAFAVYDAGDPAGAIALFEKTAARFGASDNMLHNMRVIYANWAIDSVDAGNFAEAQRIAETALARFPGDAKLTEIRDYARANQ